MESESMAETYERYRSDCFGCRFWKYDGDYDEGGTFGRCRRHAPRSDKAHFLASQRNPAPMRAIWPMTDGSEWCGEFEPDPEGIETVDVKTGRVIARGGDPV